MKSIHYRSNISRKLVTACVLGCLLTSCTVLGPSAIRSGRIAYNDAIRETNDQQLLMAVIRNRYEERGNLLAVASVTANVSVRTSTGIQLGFGDDDNFATNLVPFSGGAVYEENPTISYTPVSGEVYTRHLFSPMSMTALAQLSGNLVKPAHIYTAFVASVNGIRNPDFLFPSAEPDPRFDRFVSIMTALTHAQRLHWFEDPQNKGSFSVIIDRYAPTYEAEVSELLALLGLPAPKNPSIQVILPVSQTLDGRPTGGIGILTRSVWDLVEILSAAIELPENDQRNGVATIYPPAGLAGEKLQIRHAKARPEHASVAVKHRDGWFYIDETDQATKRFFRLLGFQWSIAIAEGSATGTAAPVLTIPTSR